MESLQKRTPSLLSSSSKGGLPFLFKAKLTDVTAHEQKAFPTVVTAQTVGMKLDLKNPEETIEEKVMAFGLIMYRVK